MLKEHDKNYVIESILEAVFTILNNSVNFMMYARKTITCV